MPLLQSFSSSQSGDKPLIKGPGKRDTFHSLPGVRSSLLGPWHVPGVGWPGFQSADTLKKIFLEPMLFTSFTCQHPEYNSRNSDLTDDWNPESKFHWQRIRNPAPDFQNPQLGIQNPRLFCSFFIGFIFLNASINWKPGQFPAPNS